MVLVSLSLRFLLDNDCHVTNECDCIAPNYAWPGYASEPSPLVGIFCKFQYLTEVPTFRNVSYKMREPWTIDLQSNEISHIKDFAFSNLQEYANGNNVSLKLGHNHLRNISDYAFSGIEPLIIYLGLEMNKLQVVPSVIPKLMNLRGLSLQYNPVTYIDPSILLQFTIV